MLQARTVSVSVNRPWRELYEAIWRPECFPRWASGLTRSTLQPDGDAWTAQGPEGPVRIHFTGLNAFGVMDHFVDTGDGPVIHVPLRVVPNGAGAEVMLTLFRQPVMTDKQFEADFAWMRRDLQALRHWAGG